MNKMPTLERTLGERFAAARDQSITALLEARDPAGHWTGELSSSALATATALCALAMVRRNSSTPRPELAPLIDSGLAWLASHANSDGGWGDTVRSFSNISTTTLAWAAFGAALEPVEQRPPPDLRVLPGSAGTSPSHCFTTPVDAAEQWLLDKGCGGNGRICPERLAGQIAVRYGKDRTFSIPILTMCAIAGRLGEGETAWRHVSQLPFELAALPARWFGAIRLPVVSYALPALIAIGQVRHHFRPTRNPLTRLLREAARRRTLRILASIQPENGGFLEATPLTAFVTMSLAAMGLADHPVAVRGVDFLIKSARADGSWAIDSNLNTWVTTLAVNALSEDAGGTPTLLPEASTIRDWLLGQQYRQVHPYTNAAPGGWAWTDLPGGVPDADDTAGALLALCRLGPINEATRRAAAAGVRWLMELQNSDGGIPTFCKGWGALPFDRSSPDITAHALRAWVEWDHSIDLDRAIARALRFLAASQKPDGSWVPLWFGHQESPDDENPLYGTARVLTALRAVAARGRWPLAGELAVKAERWLLASQNPDGGWAGASGVVSTVEETALALEALAANRRLSPSALRVVASHWGTADRGKAVEDQVRSQSGDWERARSALEVGLAWLILRVESGQWQEPAPIGFYFARLWYFERLYPLIFAAGAFRACETHVTK